MKKFSFQLSAQSVKNWVEICEDTGQDFEIIVSNYTTSIKHPDYEIKFLKHLQSNQVFAAAAKLKSDLKNKEIPNIDMEKNRYFHTNIKNDFYADRIYNIDIKSAYATILFNSGYISKDTFNYISRLQKNDRLACLGMLASKKIHFIQRGRKVLKTWEEINPLSNYFFYCVQKTEFIIQELITQIFRDDFIFSWVDGIYFSSKFELSEVAAWYLKENHGLDSKSQILTDFEAEQKKLHYKISFTDEKECLKTFCIPLPESGFKKELYSYLINKNSKK